MVCCVAVNRYQVLMKCGFYHGHNKLVSCINEVRTTQKIRLHEGLHEVSTNAHVHDTPNIVLVNSSTLVLNQYTRYNKLYVSMVT